MPTIWVQYWYEEEAYEVRLEEPKPTYIARLYRKREITLDQLNWLRRVEEEKQQVQKFLEEIY